MDEISGRDSRLPMPTFAILIDDGEYIASAPDASYPNMFVALAETIRSAAIIAAERAPMLERKQLLTCEVRDNATSEQRRVIVRLDAQQRLTGPTID